MTYLLNGDGWPPRLVCIDDTQANGAGRVNVWMEQRWCETAFRNKITLSQSHVFSQCCKGICVHLHFGGLLG